MTKLAEVIVYRYIYYDKTYTQCTDAGCSPEVVLSSGRAVTDRCSRRLNGHGSLLRETGGVRIPAPPFRQVVLMLTVWRGEVLRLPPRPNLHTTFLQFLVNSSL